MRLIDKLPLAFPFMGSRQFRGQLQRHGRAEGHAEGRAEGHAAGRAAGRAAG